VTCYYFFSSTSLRVTDYAGYSLAVDLTLNNQLPIVLLVHRTAVRVVRVSDSDQTAYGKCRVFILSLSSSLLLLTKAITHLQRGLSAIAEPLVILPIHVNKDFESGSFLSCCLIHKFSIKHNSAVDVMVMRTWKLSALFHGEKLYRTDDNWKRVL